MNEQTIKRYRRAIVVLKDKNPPPESKEGKRLASMIEKINNYKGANNEKSPVPEL